MARTAGRGEWERVQKCVWHKPAFVELSSDARCVYLWSWTRPRGPLSGLGEVSPRRIADALGPNGGAPLRDRVRAALLELAAKPLVLYDDDAEVMWTVGRMEHVGKSPMVLTRCRREYAECPPTPLKAQFLELYGELLGLSNDQGGRTT